MKHFFVISGGQMDDELADRLLEEEQPELIIAADKGMEYFYRTHRKPQVIVGDFDSVNTEALTWFKRQPDVTIHQLNPMKDDTDTESALRLAIDMGAEKITLLGGTGTRLDHVLGNVELLGIGMEKNVPITILDRHNRIRMLNRGIVIKKKEQYGKYVSLLPYSVEVNHLYLKGFKYPLTDFCLKGFCSLGVSNEICEEEARIEFDGGILLLIEAKD